MVAITGVLVGSNSSSATGSHHDNLELLLLLQKKTTIQTPHNTTVTPVTCTKHSSWQDTADIQLFWKRSCPTAQYFLSWCQENSFLFVQNIRDLSHKRDYRFVLYALWGGGSEKELQEVTQYCSGLQLLLLSSIWKKKKISAHSPLLLVKFILF